MQNDNLFSATIPLHRYDELVDDVKRLKIENDTMKKAVVSPEKYTFFTLPDWSRVVLVATNDEVVKHLQKQADERRDYAQRDMKQSANHTNDLLAKLKKQEDEIKSLEAEILEIEDEIDELREYATASVTFVAGMTKWSLWRFLKFKRQHSGNLIDARTKIAESMKSSFVSGNNLK